MIPSTKTTCRRIHTAALALAFSATFHAFAHGQIIQRWLTQWGTSALDVSQGVAVDGSGKTWVGGYTQGALGGTNAGGSDLFLTPLSSTGVRGTSVQRGGTTEDFGEAVAVVGGSTVFGVGYTQSTTAWDGAAVIGIDDALAVACSTVGAYQTTTRFGSTASDLAFAAAGNATGLLIAGGSRGSFDGQTQAGSQDAFLSKRTITGALVWTRFVGTIRPDIGTGAAFDSAGNAYLAGFTDGTLSGSTNTGGDDLFVARYNASGTRTLLKQWGSTSTDYSSDIEVDGNGNIYVTGQTAGPLGGQINSGGGDAFLTKLDSNGTVLWTRLFGGTGYEFGTGLALDAAGNVWIGGLSDSTFADHTNAGSYDAFAARYDSAGTLLNTAFWGTAGDDRVNGLAAAPDGSVSVSGITSGRLGATSAGDYDAWVASLTTIPEPATAALLFGGAVFLALRRQRQEERAFSTPAQGQRASDEPLGD